MPSLRVLHLVGSAYDDFFRDLSCRDAESCLLNTAEVALISDYQIAFVTPDSQWRFPSSLSSEDIAIAKPMSLSNAINYILEQKIDLVIPHMYCVPGMTHYRALLDLLKIPYIGNRPDLMAITAHKGKTKAIIAAAGINVPPGELLRIGDTPTMVPPVIVKPASADNSFGVSLVKETSDYKAALERAFEYSDEVLVEKFIEAGREIRASVIVKDGELIALPVEEYLVNSDDRPVRTFADKFPELDTDGNFIGYPTEKSRIRWIAKSDDLIVQKVQEAAKRCHIALNCRHYSLFDFRVDQDGEPWFLEAGLYCSFGEGGISYYALLAGIPPDELLAIVVKETLKKT